ncbi:MAG TPA: DUF1499 domain-containing protein [Rhizomicrobium sp.]
MRSQHAASVVSLVCFALGGAIALAASHGVGFGWWDYATGLKILVPGVAIALAGAAAGGLWLARALRRNDSAGWRVGAVGLSGSLVLVFVPLNQARLYLVSPPLHDISTDPEYPPPFAALLPLRKGAPNGAAYDGARIIVYDGKPTPVAVVQRKAYPDIKPFVALLNPRQAPDVHPVSILFWRGFERAKDAGFDIAAHSEQDGTIEARYTRLWFGQAIDVSIRVRAAGRIGARLDIRAESRDGDNDMGASAQLVRAYLQSLK